MHMPHTSPITAGGPAIRLLLPSLVCALLLACGGQALGATGQTAGPPRWCRPPRRRRATLEQCVTTGEQADRSATFSGEMTAIGATARMAMRIEVQERLPGEELFHTVSLRGLAYGVARSRE